MCANIYNLATFFIFDFFYLAALYITCTTTSSQYQFEIFSCFISRFPSDKGLEYNAKKEKNELMIYDTSIF